MARNRMLALLFVLAFAGAAAACGPGDDDGGNGTTDVGRPDTGQPDAVDDQGVDAPDIPTTGEDLIIAFETHTRQVEPEEWHLYTTDEDCDTWPERCDATEVAGGTFSCQIGCAISPNRDYVLWMDPASPTNLMIADLDSSWVVSSNARVLAQNVEAWQLGPDKVVFSRAGTVFAQAYSGGDPVQIVTITSQDGRGLPGGFYYAPQIDRVIVNIPTSLSAMDLREVSVSDPTDQRLLYHFVSDIEQTTGSFYQGQMDMSVSDDGQILAIVTEALDAANPCDPGASATTCDPEYYCSSDSNRCQGEMLVLHVINRDAADQLSTPGAAHRCSDSSECGQYHLCDMTNPDDANLGECVPGKRILGPQGRFSCQMDSGGTPYLDPGEYNAVIGPPMWRSDGQMVIVASNSCAGTNIDVTNLVAIDRGLTTLDAIVENPLQDHGGPECYDDVEMEYTPEGCNVEIDRARMSPTGNTIVFIADSVRSSTDTEVWMVDAFGRGGKRDVTRDILTEILDIQVFSP